MTVVDDVRAPSVQSARRHVELATWRANTSNREWDDAPSASPISGASRRGYNAIDVLALRNEISPAIAARGKELIACLFKPNTVDAAISPDDEGLSLYWAAQEMSLTIIVYADEYWWSVRNDGVCDSYSDGGESLPLLELQHSLNQFSKAVALRNPKWRSLIR